MAVVGIVLGQMLREYFQRVMLIVGGQKASSGRWRMTETAKKGMGETEMQEEATREEGPHVAETSQSAFWLKGCKSQINGV